MGKGKIDVVTKYFYPIAAGIETNILETYSVLAKNGWDVTVHTSADTYLDKNSLPKSETIKGLKVKRYPFKSELKGYMPDIDWGETDVVALHNFNISHFRILLKCLFLKLTKKKKFKLFITPHGGFNPEWRVFNWPTRIVKFTYQYFVGNIISNLVTDGFRAVSEWEKNEMIKKGISKNKIEVISNGLEDEAYMDVEKLASDDIKNKVKKFGDYIIQIGRIYPIKNYETVIKALPLIDKKINFVIVGQVEKDPKYKNSLIKLAQKLGVSERLIFAGVIRGVDKYYLIKRARMMVHMAIWESYCNVVHEGLSQGLICIVANNTALPLLVKDGINGYTVKTKNYKGLAEKINFILKNFNSKKLKDMRDTNKQIGENESWSTVSAKMGEFYSNPKVKIETKKKGFISTLAIILISIGLFVFFIKGQSSFNYFDTNKSTRVGTPFELSNTTARYALTESIIKEKSLFLTLDLAKFSAPDVVYYQSRFISIFLPLISFLGVPLYYLGEKIGAIQLTTFSLNIIFAILNLYLISAISKKLGSTHWASLIAGLVFTFATNGLVYALGFTQHQIGTSIVLLILLNFTSERTFFTNLLLGALIGIGVLADVPNLILALPVVFGLLRNGINLNKIGLVFGGIPLIVFLMWYNFYTTSSYSTLAQNIGRTDVFEKLELSQNSSDQIFQSDFNDDQTAFRFPFNTRKQLNGMYTLLVSNERAWFFYSPVILFGFFGIYQMIKNDKYRIYGQVILSAILLNIVMYSMFGDPWGGWAFGPRYLIPSAGLLAVGIAVWMTNNKNVFTYILFLLALIYSIFINSLGALTTSAIPPKIEAVNLANFIPYTYEYNWNLITTGFNSSLIYDIYLKSKFTPIVYLYILSGTVTLIFFILNILYIKYEKSKN